VPLTSEQQGSADRIAEPVEGLGRGIGPDRRGLVRRIAVFFQRNWHGYPHPFLAVAEYDGVGCHLCLGVDFNAAELALFRSLRRSLREG